VLNDIDRILEGGANTEVTDIFFSKLGYVKIRFVCQIVIFNRSCTVSKPHALIVAKVTVIKHAYGGSTKLRCF
jgi:hypothetical protein